MLIVQTNDTPKDTQKPDKSRQESVELSILDRLTDPDEQHPWVVEDVIRDFDGDRVAVLDAISELGRSGLLIQSHCLLFPTRAALHFARLKW